MVDSILFNQKRVLPCSAYLQGEYGYEGIYLGVPVKLGARGMEEIVQITLSESERRALDKSAESVRELLRVMEPAR